MGWRDVALDGLTCYHRCVEAVLRGHGFTADDVTDELGGAVTDRLGRDGKPYLRLRASSARWLIAPPGHDLWTAVRARLDKGRQVTIWPDAFFWPGDRLEGRRHAHQHAILIVGLDGGLLRYLDIDAEEAEGFAASVPLTSQTMRACTRVLDITAVARGPRIRRGTVLPMIQASIPPVIRFAEGAYALAGWWEADLRRPLVRAADLWALGDVQPQLYLLSRISGRLGYDRLAGLGYSAAAQAKKISLFLFGLRGLRPVPPYELCRDDIVVLADRLHAFARAAGEVTGKPAVPATDRMAGRWMWRRLDALSRWHFGTGLG